MKEDVDVIVHGAAEVVTCAPELFGREARHAWPARGAVAALCGTDQDDCGVWSGAALAVRDGEIVAVDDEAALLARFDAPERLDARGGTVVPGFVDAHTHPVFATTREGEFDMRARGASYQEITAAGGGIFSSVRALRDASRDELAAKLDTHLDRFLQCGTTTIEAKSGYGLTPQTEWLALELLGEADASHAVDIDRTCLAAHQVPLEFREDRDAYIRLVVDEILPAVAERGLARSADVFCDQGAYTVDEARTVLAGAQAVGLDLRVHADELAPVGAAELAAEMGARTADHLVKVSPGGITAMAEKGVTPVLLPGTCFSLRLAEVAPVEAMRAAGLPIAIASDFNPGTSYIPSMVQIISLACGLLGMTVAQALVAATRNAASTLGLPGERGMLRPGARADLCVLDVPNHLFLGYQTGWNPVDVVMKDGRVVHARRDARQ